MSNPLFIVSKGYHKKMDWKDFKKNFPEGMELVYFILCLFLGIGLLVFLVWDVYRSWIVR